MPSVCRGMLVQLALLVRRGRGYVGTNYTGVLVTDSFFARVTMGLEDPGDHLGTRGLL